MFLSCFEMTNCPQSLYSIFLFADLHWFFTFKTHPSRKHFFLNGGSPVVSTSLSEQAAGLQISTEFLDFTDTKNRYARTLKKWAKTNQYRLKQQISRDFTHFVGDNAVFCNHTMSGQSTTDSSLAAQARSWSSAIKQQSLRNSFPHH